MTQWVKVIAIEAQCAGFDRQNSCSGVEEKHAHIHYGVHTHTNTYNNKIIVVVIVVRECFLNNELC